MKLGWIGRMVPRPQARAMSRTPKVLWHRAVGHRSCHKPEDEGLRRASGANCQRVYGSERYEQLIRWKAGAKSACRPAVNSVGSPSAANRVEGRSRSSSWKLTRSRYLGGVIVRPAHSKVWEAHQKQIPEAEAPKGSRGGRH